MKQMIIGVCDDEPYFLELICNMLVRFSMENKYDLVVRRYVGADALLNDYILQVNKFDIIILDIEMPKVNGMEAARQLRESGYDGEIIFVTGFIEYTRLAYAVEAIGYIEKPAEYSKFQRIMRKAIIQAEYKITESERLKRNIEVLIDREKRLVIIETLIYVEKQRNTCILHTDKEILTCYETLKDIFIKLNQSTFSYTHQGYIVNMEKVVDIQPGRCILPGGTIIPISRRYYKALRAEFLERIRQMDI